MKSLIRYFSIVLLFVFALITNTVAAQIDIQNLTPQQQITFEFRLKQIGIEVEYNKLSAEEKEQYFQRIRQAEQEQIRSVNVNENNPFNHTLVPLTDFFGSSYQGVKGGLYPDGENTRPKSHNEAGLAIAKNIKPLDSNGIEDEKNGKIVWVSIGMSNTTQETKRFLELMKNHPTKNPHLELIDGAFGGMEITNITKENTPYWGNIVEQRLLPQGLTPEQVQIAWFKLAEAAPSDTSFATYPNQLKEKYLAAIHTLKQTFPNIKLVYLSSRIYGGYARTRLNPEPYAWYTGWANKFLIEDQLNGDPRLNYYGQDAKAPWLSWGPYLWSNGVTPNAQGIHWLESDMEPDGTHPATGGVQKVAESLIKFFSTDETSVPWFLHQR